VSIRWSSLRDIGTDPGQELGVRCVRRGHVSCEVASGLANADDAVRAAAPVSRLRRRLRIDHSVRGVSAVLATTAPGRPRAGFSARHRRRVSRAPNASGSRLPRRRQGTHSASAPCGVGYLAEKPASVALCYDGERSPVASTLRASRGWRRSRDTRRRVARSTSTHASGDHALQETPGAAVRPSGRTHRRCQEASYPREFLSRHWGFNWTRAESD
jgi:hypothetical protein